jgi:hypothetical protein
LHNRIDKCIRPFIKWLKNKHCIVASCCGHNRYPKTIIVKEYRGNALKREIVYLEIFSQKIIPRTRKFYKKDKRGYYYIPEVSKENVK